MPKCRSCGKEFPNKIETNGKIKQLSGRHFCLECSPLGGSNRRPHIIATEPGKAFCARCQKNKNRNEFHNRKGGQKPLSYCRVCSEEVKQLKLQEKLEKGVTFKGGSCADCGGIFPMPVFIFISNGEKIQTGKIKNMSWERFKEKLINCEMLCHNCEVLRKWESEDV